MTTKINKSELINEVKSLKKVGVAFSIKVIGTFFAFIISIIISRNFSASGVGIYSLTNSILSICAIISKFGFDNSLIKYASIDYSKKRYGNLRKKFKTVIIISSVIAFALSLIITLGASEIASVFNKDDLEILLRIMIWVLIPSTIIELFAAIFKAIKRINIGLFFESVSVNAMRCLLLILLVVILNNKKIEWLGYSFIIAACVILAAAYCLWRYYSKDFDNTVTNHYKFRPVVDTALPLLIVNSTNYILNSTDILMIGFWLSSSDVGIYNIATKITLFSSMLLSAINAILGPKFAVLYKNNEMETLKKLVKRSSRLMFLAAIFISLGLGICAKWILMIWGKKYILGINVLYISLIGQFFVLSTGPLATLLMMCGLEKVHRNNTIVCAVINVLLNFFLIQHIGIIGAAMSTMISLIIKNLYCVYAVKKRLGFFCY